MTKELTWKEELKLARGYAQDGPDEWSPEYMERCLSNAAKKADAESIDISDEIDRIRNRWNNPDGVIPRLTDQEKKLLNIMHEARLIDGKLLKEYEITVKKHIAFTYDELHNAINRFVNEGLLQEIQLAKNDCLYMLTDRVPHRLLDSDILT
jgi:hypothetical protein